MGSKWSIWASPLLRVVFFFYLRANLRKWFEGYLVPGIPNLRQYLPHCTIRRRVGRLLTRAWHWSEGPGNYWIHRCQAHVKNNIVSYNHESRGQVNNTTFGLGSKWSIYSPPLLSIVYLFSRSSQEKIWGINGRRNTKLASTPPTLG